MKPQTKLYLPCEILQVITHHVDDFATLSAISLSSKTLWAIATPRMLRLALAHDRRRIRDPGFLVFWGIALKSCNAKALEKNKSNLDFYKLISDDAILCEEEIKAAATPVVLWSAMQPPELATKILDQVEQLDPKHLWSLFLVPGTDCRTHWPLPPNLPIRHSLCAPLHVAARYGNTKVVSWLLDRQRLAIHAKSILWPHLGSGLHDSGTKPINLPAIQPCVCPSHHLKVYFRTKDMEDPTDMPWAPALHIALAHSHLETAKLLVDRGAGWAIGQHGTDGITALMIACANGLLPFLDHLLDLDLSEQQIRRRSILNIDWEDYLPPQLTDYVLAVGSISQRKMLQRRLDLLKERCSRAGMTLDGLQDTTS